MKKCPYCAGRQDLNLRPLRPERKLRQGTDARQSWIVFLLRPVRVAVLVAVQKYFPISAKPIDSIAVIGYIQLVGTNDENNETRTRK